MLDEIHIDPVAVLVGAGIRMLDNLDPARLKGLDIARVVEGQGVTHLRYHVLK